MDDTRKRQIETIINQAKKTEITLAEIEEYGQQEDEIVHDFLRGAIDSKEYNNRLEKLSGQPQRVILYDVEELEYALNYLNVTTEEQQELFEHEMAHFSQAIVSGLQARFSLTFYRSGNGRLAMIGGAQINATLLNTLNDDEKRVGLIAAIAAPKYPSPTDKRLLL